MIIATPRKETMYPIYSGIYSTKSPASGAGDVNGTSREIARSHMRVDQRVPAVPVLVC